MNNLKVAPITSTSISWRDEISCSYDTESEGFEKLKEAIKQAKLSNSPSESPASEARLQSDARAKSAAGGI